MSEKKPTPLIPARAQRHCPVCGKISYSHAGVHPQCSVRLADEKAKSRIKREKLSADVEKKAAAVVGIASWQKCCPKCKTLQHVRKIVCGCGHAFAVRPRPPTSEGEQT